MKRNQTVTFSCYELRDVKWFFTESMALPTSFFIHGGPQFEFTITNSGFLYCYGKKSDGKDYVDKAVLDVTG